MASYAGFMLPPVKPKNNALAFRDIDKLSVTPPNASAIQAQNFRLADKVGIAQMTPTMPQQKPYNNSLVGGDVDTAIVPPGGDQGGIVLPEDTTTETTETDFLAEQAALYEAQKTAVINALKAAAAESEGRLKTNLDASLKDLGDTRSGIADTYYGKRNQAAAQSDVGAMNFAQYMAARGIKGSAGGIPEIYRNAGLQGVLGGLNTAEAQEDSAIDRQESLLRTNFGTDITTLYNKLDADMASAGANIDAQATAAKIQALKDALAKTEQQEQTTYERDYLAAQVAGIYDAMAKWGWSPAQITAANKAALWKRT